jgi:hypothetical protein
MAMKNFIRPNEPECGPAQRGRMGHLLREKTDRKLQAQSGLVNGAAISKPIVDLCVQSLIGCCS